MASLPVSTLAPLEQRTRALDQGDPLTGWRLPECFAYLRRLLEGRLKEAWQPRVRSGDTAAGDLRAPGSKPCHRTCLATGHDQLRCSASSHAVPHRRRPPRLDMENYPHLPLAQVQTTQAADYMSALVEMCA